jgi:hypothetical protein
MRGNIFVTIVIFMMSLMFGVAHAALVTFDFSAAGLTATGLLVVSGNQATSGTGRITGPTLGGSETLTLVTLATPGVHNLGGGNLSYRFGGGTDLIGDTYIDYIASPIVDADGLVFLVSGPDDTGFNLWSDSATSYTGFLASNTLYAGYNGTMTAQDPWECEEEADRRASGTRRVAFLLGDLKPERG